MPVTFRTSVAILVAVTCNNGAAMAESVFGRKLIIILAFQLGAMTSPVSEFQSRCLALRSVNVAAMAQQV